MAFSNPSVADFQGYFVRDFPYGTDPKAQVLDSDIAKAFQQCNMQINPGFFSDQGSYNVGYFNLTAHYLVLNLRNSSQGLNGQYNFLQNSKSAAQISEAFGIPQKILDTPAYAMLCKTNYGAMYLQMVLPQLSGQVFTVFGRTLP